MLTQRQWRIAGGICLGVCVLMVIIGPRLEILHSSHGAFLVFWAVFAVLFMTAVYCALLDFRYTRVYHAEQERDLYKDTLGDEAFRKALREAQEEAAKHGELRKRK